MKLGCWHMKAIADGHLNNIVSNVKALVGPFNNEQREGPSRNFPKIVKLQTSQRFVSSCSALAAPVSQHLSWLQRGSEMIRSLGPATSLSSQPVSSVTTPLLVTRFQLPRMPDMWSSLGGLLTAAWYYRYFFNLFTFLSKVYLKFWTHAGAVSTVSYQDKDDTNKRFKNSFLSRSLIWPIPIICHFFHHINLHRRLWGIFKHQTQGTPGTWPGIMETMPPSATIDLCGTQCLSNTNSVSWWLWVCEVFWIEEQQLCICSADIWPLIKFDISQGLRNWNRKSEIETHFKNSWGDINLIIMSPHSHTTYNVIYLISM